MATRESLKPVKTHGNYFSGPKANLEFIPTGSRLLDLALGGGWVRRRAANIIGDSSTGKTLLAIEAMANFARLLDDKGKKFRIKYRESEEAFDEDYADALVDGLTDRIDFGDPIDTVEDMFEDLDKTIRTAKGIPTLYIVDSLDGLTDRAEKERKIDEGSYGAGKAKKLSELFRRQIRDMGDADITLLIISQIRDKIGAVFGRKFMRTGGKAMDFYMSQIVILSQLGRIDKTIKGIDRKVGLKVKALVDKNKVGLAYREAEFNIMFGYGVDDLEQCLEFLKKTDALKHVPLKELDIRTKDDANLKTVANRIRELPKVKHKAAVNQIENLVAKNWYDVEQGFMPARGKYE